MEKRTNLIERWRRVEEIIQGKTKRKPKGEDKQYRNNEEVLQEWELLRNREGEEGDPPVQKWLEGAYRQLTIESGAGVNGSIEHGYSVIRSSQCPGQDEGNRPILQPLGTGRGCQGDIPRCLQQLSPGESGIFGTVVCWLCSGLLQSTPQKAGGRGIISLFIYRKVYPSTKNSGILTEPISVVDYSLKIICRYSYSLSSVRKSTVWSTSSMAPSSMETMKDSWVMNSNLLLHLILKWMLRRSVIIGKLLNSNQDKLLKC